MPSGERTVIPVLEPLPSWDLGRTWATFTGGTFHGSIRGVEIQKSDDDLERYREAIEISQPDVVIETGTRAGGSALWFHYEMGLQVITIDIAPAFTNRGGQPPWVVSSGVNPGWQQPGIVSLRGSSISDDILRQAMPLVRDKRVMVSLDSDHHAAHVKSEITTWSPWVSPGCYMVVEDACFDLFADFGQPDWARVGGYQIPEVGGPLVAMRESGLERSTRFWRDEAVEGITDISHSPCGWWRKHE